MTETLASLRWKISCLIFSLQITQIRVFWEIRKFNCHVPSLQSSTFYLTTSMCSTTIHSQIQFTSFNGFWWNDDVKKLYFKINYPGRSGTLENKINLKYFRERGNEIRVHVLCSCVCIVTRTYHTYIIMYSSMFLY